MCVRVCLRVLICFCEHLLRVGGCAFWTRVTVGHQWRRWVWNHSRSAPCRQKQLQQWRGLAQPLLTSPITVSPTLIADLSGSLSIWPSHRLFFLPQSVPIHKKKRLQHASATLFYPSASSTHPPFLLSPSPILNAAAVDMHLALILSNQLWHSCHE